MYKCSSMTVKKNLNNNNNRTVVMLVTLLEMSFSHTLSLKGSEAHMAN